MLGYVVTALLALAAGAYLERLKSREWVKKEQWKYKRDIYEKLFRAFAHYETLQRLYSVVSEERDNLGEKEAEEKQKGYAKQMEEAMLEIESLVPLAKVFASDETMKALYDFPPAMKELNNQARSAATERELDEVLKRMHKPAAKVLGALTRSAKSDMEFDQKGSGLMDDLLS